MRSFVLSVLLGASVNAEKVLRAKSSTATSKPFDGLSDSVTTIAYDDRTFTARSTRAQHSTNAFRLLEFPRESGSKTKQFAKNLT